MVRPDEREIEQINPEWHESLFAVELALLHAAPVYYGIGTPKGDGSAVVLFPGFLHGEAYLLILYAWLKRIGYRPYFSQIGFNASCPNVLIRDIVIPVISTAARETAGAVHLIGHSLGGVIARSVAVQRRDIASVITLGSPLQQTSVRSRIFDDAETVRKYLISQHPEKVQPQCLTAECPCPFMKSVHRRLPRRVQLTAIFTRDDGLIEWTSCRSGNPKVDVEVSGTHRGLAFNPAVYKVIAERLAASSTRKRAAHSAA